MNWTLEVVQVPVSDVDRARDFYERRLGFHVDFDLAPGADARLVQLTPPGSGCSIIIGRGMVADMRPGSLQGLQLVVSDIHAARAQLVERGVDVSEVQSSARTHGQCRTRSTTSRSSSSTIPTATVGPCSRSRPAPDAGAVDPARSPRSAPTTTTCAASARRSRRSTSTASWSRTYGAARCTLCKKCRTKIKELRTT